MRNKQSNRISPEFKRAVEATPDVRNCYQSGLQAVESKDRNKFRLRNSRNCQGSLFIDHCLESQGKYANENRWDYAICYDGEVFFAEVHPAITHEVPRMINKLNWLKKWLKDQAPRIEELKAHSSPYIWIQTSGNHIIPTTSQYRQMAEAKLKTVPVFELG